MPKRVEVLAMAIATHNKFFEPESEAFRLANPGLLRSYAFKTLAETDERGTRKFTSFIGGYRALCDDIEAKIRGQRRGVKGERVLSGLLASYRASAPAAIFELADFISRALGQEVGAETPLDFFIEEQ